jgi:lipid-binding SYLF domain-containing protein
VERGNNVPFMARILSSRWALGGAALVAAALATPLVSGCERSTPPPRTAATDSTPQQRIVNEATVALQTMRTGPQGALLDQRLRQGAGIMVFPHVTRAALLLGGSGGNGVLLAKDSQGRWSAPAFYTLNAGSAGAQIGYEDSTVVLVFMNGNALRSAIDNGLTLGANASVAAGTMGNSDRSRSAVSASDIYEFVGDQRGVYAGASLSGTVVRSRDSFDRDYYGQPGATAYNIVVERRFDSPGARELQNELSHA